MARAKTGSPQLRHRDAAELLRRFDVGRMRLFLDAVFPQAETQQVGANTLRLRCQTGRHPDVHPSMHVDLRRGRVECRPCSYATRHVLQFLQDCRGWSFGEGLRQLQTLTGVRVVGERLVGAFEDLDAHRDAVRAIAWACNRYLTAMLAPPPNDPTYDVVARHAAGPSLAWLYEHRGRDRDLAYALPYGLWPPRDILLAMVEARLDFVANEEYGVRRDTRLTPERKARALARARELAGVAGPEWTYAVVYVTGHDFQTPGRIRLRRPDPEDRKQGNLLVLPGFDEDEPNGWFGLWAPHLAGLKRGDARVLRALCVEGENDTLTVAEGLLSAGLATWLVIGSCGNANDTDALVGAGIDTLYALSDHPAADIGRGEVWLRHRLQTAHEVDVRVFTRWAALAAGDGLVKDPDDVVRAHGFEHFRRHVLDDPERAFVAADVWAADAAAEAGRDEEDVRVRTQVAVRYGECLGHAAQLASYIDRVATTLGVTPGVVRGQIAQGRDDEEGFLARIADTLLRDLQLLYKEDSLRGGIIHAYHRASHRPVGFPVDDGSATLAALANVNGQGLDYVRDRVGLPGWLLEGKGEGGPSVRDLQKPLADYARIAVQRLYHGLPARDECELFGLGPHLLPMPDAPGGVVQRYNLGTHVAAGDFIDEERLRWLWLDGPAEARRIYATHPQSWSGSILTIDDLVWGNSVSLDELSEYFHLLTDLLGCWAFRRGHDEALLLAAFLFQLCVPHFCEEKSILGVLGPQSSGKSTLMSLFAGGQFPHLRLVDPVSYQSNYTVASLFHSFDRSTLLMALEEFTKAGAHAAKTRQVEDVTEFLRQVLFPGGAQVKRVYSGGTRTFAVRTNVMTTSIRPAADAQDASRRLEIEMRKEIGHRDPGIELLRRIGAEKFARMRRAINLGLPKFYHRYQRHYAAVATALATETLVPFPVETRFLRNFLGVGAMVALLGGDWRALVTNHLVARRASLDAYAYATPTFVLLDTLLRTSWRLGAAQTSALALLGERDKWPVLNSAACGLYYNDEKGFLVVDWIAVLSPGGVLARTEPWHREPYHTLKYQLDQHPDAVAPENYAELGVERFLGAYGVSAAPHTISVLRIGGRVAEVRNRNQRQMPETPAATAETSNVIDLPVGSRDRRPSNF